MSSIVLLTKIHQLPWERMQPRQTLSALNKGPRLERRNWAATVDGNVAKKATHICGGRTAFPRRVATHASGCRRRLGASAIEYSILLGLIVIAALAVLGMTGTRVTCIFTKDTNSIAIANGASNASMSCNPAFSAPVWTSAELVSSPYQMPTGTDGTAYSAALSATSPTHNPLTYSIVLGTLPAGLHLNAATGVISGTPSASATGAATSQQIGVVATDNQNMSSQVLSVLIPMGGHIVFTYTGSDQTFTMPVASVQVKLWGAGGGETGSNVSGGPGGFAKATYSGAIGTSLTVIVGQSGGMGSGAGSYGGGGAKTNTLNSTSCVGGQGGGRTALALGGADVVTAGGGGGGGYAVQAGYGNGGAGGGAVGNNGQADQASSSEYGYGGTQTNGGAGGSNNTKGSNAGGPYQGGLATTSDDCNNGSGGGGYYGGGSGSDAGAGGGGGGSGYAGGVGVTNGVLTAGSGSSAPMTSDADFVVGVGVGGTSSAGGPGEAVITWGP